MRAHTERPVEAGPTLYGDDGTLIDADQLRSIASNCLREISAEEPTEGPVTQRFVDHAPAFHVIDGNGARLGVRRLNIEVTYEITSSLIPFDFREYVDKAKGKQLYSAAIAAIDSGELKGDFIILHKDGEGAKVMFVPTQR